MQRLGSFKVLIWQCPGEQLEKWFAWIWKSLGIHGHNSQEFHQEKDFQFKEEFHQVRSVPAQPLQQRATGYIVDDDALSPNLVGKWLLSLHVEERLEEI